MAKSKSSTFSPSPVSTRCRMSDDEKSELIRGKTDSVKKLSQMIDELYIDEDNRDAIGELIQKATTPEEIAEPMRNSMRTAIPSYDIDGMSFEDLQASLRRIKETPQQPFSFLASIYEIFSEKNQLASEAAKSTEIDIQLAAVAKRIESSRALLEEAKSRVSEIRLRARQDSARCRSYRQIYTHETPANPI